MEISRKKIKIFKIKKNLREQAIRNNFALHVKLFSPIITQFNTTEKWPPNVPCLTTTRCPVLGFVTEANRNENWKRLTSAKQDSLDGGQSTEREAQDYRKMFQKVEKKGKQNGGRPTNHQSSEPHSSKWLLAVHSAPNY